MNATAFMTKYETKFKGLVHPKMMMSLMTLPRRSSP